MLASVLALVFKAKLSTVPAWSTAYAYTELVDPLPVSVQVFEVVEDPFPVPPEVPVVLPGTEVEQPLVEHPDRPITHARLATARTIFANFIRNLQSQLSRFAQFRESKLRSKIFRRWFFIRDGRAGVTSWQYY